VAGRQLLPNATTAHLDLARRCLEHLTFFALAQPFSGTLTKEWIRATFGSVSFILILLCTGLDIYRSLILNATPLSRHHCARHGRCSRYRLCLFSIVRKRGTYAWIEAHYLSVGLLNRWEPLNLCPTPILVRLGLAHHKIRQHHPRNEHVLRNS